MQRGRVILYADTMTKSIKSAVTETERRRALQQKYNKEHGITPHTITKEIKDNLDLSRSAGEESAAEVKKQVAHATKEEISILEEQMLDAAAALEFEVAAALRDKIKKLKGEH